MINVFDKLDLGTNKLIDWQRIGCLRRFAKDIFFLVLDWQGFYEHWFGLEDRKDLDLIVFQRPTIAHLFAGKSLLRAVRIEWIYFRPYDLKTAVWSLIFSQVWYPSVLALRFNIFRIKTIAKWWTPLILVQHLARSLIFNLSFWILIRCMTSRL